MSNEIDEYKLAQQRLKRFLSWRSLIGKEYFGGTRGKGGQFGTVVPFETACSLTIYHQEYDGSNNYHNSDPDLRGEFTQAAIRCAPAILDSVQQQLESNVLKAKQNAEKLAQEILL